MARQKSYDRKEAVDVAMKTFWQKGYTNVGVRQIERKTSINRFAPQTEFGGKEGLFLEALESYLKLSQETALLPLKGRGLDGICEFFELLVTSPESMEKSDGEDTRNYGCLMVNTVIENVDLGSKEIQKVTTAHYNGMQRSFEHCLEIAKRQGEIGPQFNVVAAARYLLTFAMGIEVYVRMIGNVSAAREQVDFAMEEVKNWRV